jgi:hypothetical protein
MGEGKMIYRRKIYHVNPDFVESFNQHFNKTLLPAQLKYGARLVGRWMASDHKAYTEIFAIWEYADLTEYQEIEQQVRNDKEHRKRVEAWYGSIGGRENAKMVFSKIEQDFLTATVPHEDSLVSPAGS